VRTHQESRKAGTYVPILLCALFLIGFSPVSWAAPKLLPQAGAGDCKACHGTEKALPESHPDTAAMAWEACAACHREGKMKLAGKMPGSHLHQLRGVTCIKCHGPVKEPQALKMDQCVACHGSTEKLAEKTAKVKPSNPHTSPHYGTTLDCNFCHKQHEKSENFCAQCHQFQYTVP
jgi:hypothetical protein